MTDDVIVNSDVAQNEAPATAPADGRRRAAAVLEVLAGVRTPQDAAKALGIALPSYYMLEGRALEGLVEACEPRKKGRVAVEAAPSLDRLKTEVVRQQSLIRSMQKSLGLVADVEASGERKRRRPAVRALRAAKKLLS